MKNELNLDTVIDELIIKYSSEEIIPILGCELFKIDLGSNNLVNIHEYIIKKAFHTSPEWPEPPQLLSELQLAETRFTYNSLKGCYRQLKEWQKKVKLLNQIANLNYFKVFLIAFVFEEFEKEFKKSNSEEIEIYTHDTVTTNGLPSIDFTNNKRKIIYLFDHIESGKCAFNDEDLLESMYSLANSRNTSSGHSLLPYLKDKTLLFIGCDFPDWFMRYCIRVLSSEKTSANITYIINDHPPKLKYQEFFFSKHNIQLIQTSPVDEFIHKFCEKALKTEMFKNRFANSQIFISYSKSFDSVIAKNLYHKFREQGVETYFDEEVKEIGSHEEKITQYIMSSMTKIIVCVISKDLMKNIKDDMYRDKRNYISKVEWYAAEVRNFQVATRISEIPKINIVPYFVDNEREYLSELPAFISAETRFGEYHGGFEDLFDKAKKVLS